MKTLALVIIAAALSGCTVTKYTDPSGATFSRSSFLTTQNVGKVVVEAGDKTLTLEAYSNQQTEVAAAIVSAAVSAARKGGDK